MNANLEKGRAQLRRRANAPSHTKLVLGVPGARVAAARCETVRLRRTERGFAVSGSPAAVALFYWRHLGVLRIVAPMTIGVLGLSRLELTPWVSVHSTSLSAALINRLMRLYGINAARLAQRTGVSTVCVRQIRRDGVSGNGNVRAWLNALTEGPPPPVSRSGASGMQSN